MAFNFGNTASPDSTSSNVNSNTQSPSSANADSNGQQVTTSPNNPSTRAVNPLSNSNTDKQTNALAGLAEMLRIGQHGQQGQQNAQGNFNDSAARRGASQVEGASQQNGQGNNANNSPNQGTSTGNRGGQDQTTMAIQQLLSTFKGDTLHEYDLESIGNGLRDGNIEPLTEQIDLAVNAGIQRVLNVMLNQIAPGLIEAAVNRSVDRASDTISVNSVWNEFSEAYPQLAQAENLIRPQLEQTYRNTGDKRKAMEAIVAVYGHAGGVGTKKQDDNDPFRPSQPFNIDAYFNS